MSLSYRKQSIDLNQSIDFVMKELIEQVIRKE